MNVLIILRLDAALAQPYSDPIRAAFPEANVNVICNVEDGGSFFPHADVIASFGSHLKDHALRDAVNLKWIHLFGTGVDGVLCLPSLRKDVIVTHSPGLHGASISEAAIMFMLALSRDLKRAVHQMDRRLWDQWASPVLEGKTLGILGVGLIAEELAPRAKAFRMKVIGISGTPRPIAAFDEIRHRDELLQVAPELDYLAVLTPYSMQTHGLINGRVFAAMKRTSYLINLARGKVIDEAALIDALEKGLIAGAGLDVTVEEPMSPTNPLWGARNLIVTPHLAAMYHEYPARAAALFNENCRRYLASGGPTMLHQVTGPWASGGRT